MFFIIDIKTIQPLMTTPTNLYEAVSLNVDRYNALLGGKRVSGPVSFTFIPYFMGKSLYFFGDRHTAGENCGSGYTPIENLLDDIFKSKSKPNPIDFYFEHTLSGAEGSPSRIKKHWDDDQYGGFPIAKVRETFEDCIKSNTRVLRETACKKWPQIRIQNMDIRFSVSGKAYATPFTILRGLSGLRHSKGYSVHNSPSAFMFTGDEFLKYTSSIVKGGSATPKISDELFKKMFAESGKVFIGGLESPDALYRNLNKELSKSYIAPLIREWASDVYGKKAIELDSLLSKKLPPGVENVTVRSRTPEADFIVHKSVSQPSENVSIADFAKVLFDYKQTNKINRVEVVGPPSVATFFAEMYSKISTFSTEAEAIFMDMYSLARMFKTPRQDGLGEIWVYAGDLHISNYLSFIAFVISKEGRPVNFDWLQSNASGIRGRPVSKKCIEFHKIYSLD